MQRRAKPTELLGLVSGGAHEATWTLECEPVETTEGYDLKGPYIQGPPGARFIYLSWGDVDAEGHFEMFRRAKLWVNALPIETVQRAISTGTLTGRLGLTDRAGNPLCASVRPPLIEWSA